MADEERPAPPRGAAFWLGLLVGSAIIAYGAHGLFSDAPATNPRNLAVWFFGAGLLHDLVVAPVAFVLAWALGRVLPPPARRPVQLALAASALLVLFTWPVVRGYGRDAAIPSALPLDYTRNLVGALVAIWVVALVWSVVGAVRSGRDR